MAASRVFISYSHDSPDHKAWVARLASYLREARIQVSFDQDVSSGTNLAHLMETALSDSDRVLFICTDDSIRKANAREGGFGYEANLASADLISDQNSKKYIPLVRNVSLPEKTPRFLAGRKYIDFSNDDDFAVKLSELIGDLQGGRRSQPLKLNIGTSQEKSSPPISNRPYFTPLLLHVGSTTYRIVRAKVRLGLNTRSTEVGSRFSTFTPSDPSVAVARRIATSFLTSKGRKLRNEHLELAIDLPKGLETAQHSLWQLAVALAVIGHALHFKAPDVTIALGIFGIGSENEFLRQGTNQPVHDAPLQLSDELEGIQEIFKEIAANGFTQLVYPESARGEWDSAETEIQKTGVRNIEEAVAAYYGDQWEDWLEANSSSHWSKPRNFIDRSAKLQETWKQITNNQITVVQGLPGAGKTMVIQALREKYRVDFKDTEIFSLRGADELNPCRTLFMDLGRFLYHHGHSRLQEALNEDLNLDLERSYQLSEIALRDLDRDRYLLVFDNIERTLDRDRRISRVWSPLFDAMLKSRLQRTKIVFVTDVEMRIDNKAVRLGSIHIPGFEFLDAKNFFRELENSIPNEAGYEQISDSAQFKDLHEVTGGNPTALIYIFALHRLRRIPYRELLAERETYIVSSDRSLSVGGNSVNVKALLAKIFDLLPYDRCAALEHFSVYRHPVRAKALEAIEGKEWFSSVDELEAFLLIAQRRDRYELYPLAKDLAHIGLRRSRASYRKYHKKAANYFKDEAKRYQLATHLLNEAIYHFEEAGSQRSANELLVAHPSLRRADEFLRFRNYIAGAEQYRKYVGYMGLGCASKTLSNYAYCLEKIGDPEKAVEYYERAIRTANNGNALGRLARLYLDLWVQMDTEWIKKEYSSLAESFSPSELKKKVFTLYEQAVNSHCEEIEFYFEFYRYFHSNAEGNLANRAFLAAMENLSPYATRFQRGRLINDIARFHQEIGEYSLGLEKLEQTINSSESKYAVPDYAGSYITAADIHLEQHLTYRAIEVLQEGIKNTRDNRPRYRGRIEVKLGHLYLKNGDEDKALELFETAIRLSPENPGARVALANLYFKRKGSADKVLLHVHQALRSRLDEKVLDTVVQLLHKIYHNLSPSLAEMIRMWWAPFGKKPSLPPARLWLLLRTRSSIRQATRHLVTDEEETATKLDIVRNSLSVPERIQAATVLATGDYSSTALAEVVTSALCDVAQNPENSLSLRSGVISVLGELRSARVRELLSGIIHRTDEESEALHFPAIFALREMVSEETQGDLMWAASSPNPLVSFTAIEALGHVDESNFSNEILTLTEVFEANTSCYVAIVPVLSQLDLPEGREYLTNKFATSHTLTVRVTVAVALAKERNDSAVQFLLEQLSQTFLKKENRYAACIALTFLADWLKIDDLPALEREGALARLFDCLSLCDPEVKPWVFMCLAEASTSEAAFESILEMTEKQSPSAKIEFLKQLTYLQPCDISSFVKFLYEDDIGVQSAALHLFDKFALPESIPMLTEFAVSTKVFSSLKMATDIIQRLGGEQLRVGKQCEAQVAYYGRCPYLLEEGQQYCQEHKNYVPPPPPPRSTLRKVRVVKSAAHSAFGSVSNKIRIYDLAKKLKVDSKRIIDEVRAEGIDVSVPANTIGKELADRIAEKYYVGRENMGLVPVRVVRKFSPSIIDQKPHDQEKNG